MMNIRRIIREELEKVLNPPPEVIDIDWDEGSVFGVIHFDREHINNWIESERVQPNLDTIKDDELFPIGILKNINVNEEYRGQGFGIDLMENFLTECSHCQYVILISDLGEEQKEGFNLVDWYKSFGFTIFGESGGNPVMIKKMNNMINEGHTTNSSNYEFEPLEIWVKLKELDSIGKKLDSNYSKNISELKVLSIGERSGRLLAEVGYPDGTVVLFYKSSKGNGGKEMGGWFPIPGFLKSPANGLGLKQGWFIKTNGVEDRYGIKTFQGTADYLKANEDSLGEDELGEIYLSAGGQGLKPGPGRKFPEENQEPGDSLNLSVSDGPHQFPK